MTALPPSANVAVRVIKQCVSGRCPVRYNSLPVPSVPPPPLTGQPSSPPVRLMREQVVCCSRLMLATLMRGGFRQQSPDTAATAGNVDLIAFFRTLTTGQLMSVHFYGKRRSGMFFNCCFLTTGILTSSLKTDYNVRTLLKVWW